MGRAACSFGRIFWVYPGPDVPGQRRPAAHRCRGGLPSRARRPAPPRPGSARYPRRSESPGQLPAAIAANPVPNSVIRATVDTRLVSPISSVVVDAATPSASSVLMFSNVRSPIRRCQTGGDETTMDVGVLKARVCLVAGPRVGDPGRGLIIGGLHVEERARHHRDRGRDCSGPAGQQHRAGIRCRGGHAEDQTEDRDRPVLHAEDDGAHRGEEGAADPAGPASRVPPVEPSSGLWSRDRAWRRASLRIPGKWCRSSRYARLVVRHS